jgi:RNA 3'-terminal phosphate cyclase (ATP)
LSQGGPELIVLDGSAGEGGGQIVRTALTLSLVTGRPFRVDHIRAKRRRPGLLRQHLTAVRAATAVGQAQVTGAEAGSMQLSFVPGPIRPGRYAFSVGTAGSAMLVLQTVIPALMTASGESEVEVEGGTHNPASPPFDFLERTFVPLLAKLGPRVDAQLLRPGFYPAGGGRARLVIHPAAQLAPLHLHTRGELVRRRIVARVAGLSTQIAERQLQVFLQRTRWPRSIAQREVLDPLWGPGNVLLVELEFEHLTEIVAGFGEKRLRAEAVAEQTAHETLAYLAHGAPVGEHLADQLLLPLALAGEGSYTAGPLTLHTRTQIETIQRFLDVKIDVEELADGRAIVRVGRSVGRALDTLVASGVTSSPAASPAPVAPATPSTGPHVGA